LKKPKQARPRAAAGERACPEAALLAFVYVASLTMASVLIAVLGR